MIGLLENPGSWIDPEVAEILVSVGRAPWGWSSAPEHFMHDNEKDRVKNA
jgi:hypothetical protein